ncbi:MAG: helicase [Prolixibacteraceae bacterium]|nr:helicase [Prolixibacteraceae bacterium]MBT6763303.1 helicase [Prolixibacteraceae bacterium]MBT6997840.1 helicase [Prolixibacteraceae bacterium]MBT7394204.1 helicase [Prolixibacteraceae bacterium]
MSKEFITNQEKLLSDVVNNYLKDSENLYFLVGFFYFSGFEEIFENLIDKNLKILVGLEIEKGIMNQVKEVENLSLQNFSRGEIRDNFNKSLVELFNETNFFDTRKNIKAFKSFYNKIKDGTLEIRKTKEPNHSKMYLFEFDEEHSHHGEDLGTVVTGSSNLTRSGLRGQFELNVVLKDNSDFEKGKEIFDTLWKQAVIIADKDNIKIFEDDVIEKIWFEKLYKPILLYIRVLHEYFSINLNQKVKYPHEITKERFLNLRYQMDAIQLALSTIERHNGVIVADVVGLGKSIIASAAAHNLNLKTIVIAPPHLVKQWDDEYRDYFDFNAKVFSSGNIAKALEYLNSNSDGEPRLIMVDEAHKYRNEETQDYGLLHNLCQGNKVILLTATPFNNRPQDVFSMIKLFQIPAKSTLKTVGNLAEEFFRLIAEYKKLEKIQKEQAETPEAIKERLDDIARQIRLIISPIVIRRSRLDLKDITAYKKDIAAQGIEFPIVNPPEELQYSLGNLEELYIYTLERIASDDGKNCFKGTRYRPVTYLKDFKKYKKVIEEEFGNFNLFKNSQNQISKFMRRLLVKRFESSVAAFESTLKYMILSSENIQKWIKVRNTVPIFKKGNLLDIEKYYQISSDDVLKEVEGMNLENDLSKLKKKGLFEIPIKDIRNGFLTDLESDISILKSLYEKWFKNGIGEDPKLDQISKILHEHIKLEPKRKIIVFSEYADTVDYLEKNLKNKLPVFKYTSNDASVKNKQIISTNFDAGLPKTKQENKYKILLATDAISEGYNLHRAGMIINYDIPYNPTRVIQRIGRINRINKKVFDVLYIYNYFPSSVGENETRTKQISTLKIAMIQALLGDDTKALTSDEELQSFFKEVYKKEFEKSEARSWDTKHKDYYLNLTDTNSELLKLALKIPKRSRIARQSDKQTGVLVFGKKGNDFVFRLAQSADETLPLPPEEALQLFEANLTESPYKVSDNFETLYEKVKADLFKRNTQVPNEKLKREVLDRLEVIQKNSAGNLKDFLADLVDVINLDALPRHYLKFLNKVKPNKAETIPEKISSHYISTILKSARSVDEGEELLILSEEFINPNTSTKSEA